MQRKSYYDKIEKLKLKQELAGVVIIEKSYALADHIQTTPNFCTLSDRCDKIIHLIDQTEAVN